MTSFAELADGVKKDSRSPRVRVPMGVRTPLPMTGATAAQQQSSTF